MLILLSPALSLCALGGALTYDLVGIDGGFC